MYVCVSHPWQITQITKYNWGENSFNARNAQGDKKSEEKKIHFDDNLIEVLLTKDSVTKRSNFRHQEIIHFIACIQLSTQIYLIGKKIEKRFSIF